MEAHSSTNEPEEETLKNAGIKTVHRAAACPGWPHLSHNCFATLRSIDAFTAAVTAVAKNAVAAVAAVSVVAFSVKRVAAVAAVNVDENSIIVERCIACCGGEF